MNVNPNGTTLPGRYVSSLVRLLDDPGNVNPNGTTLPGMPASASACSRTFRERQPGVAAGAGNVNPNGGGKPAMINSQNCFGEAERWAYRVQVRHERFKHALRRRAFLDAQDEDQRRDDVETQADLARALGRQEEDRDGQG